jgi:glycosyltransferase involved in cell wall biosynthesis
MKNDLYSDERLNFVTLFPTAEGVHLCKDVGQIPYIFNKKFGMNGLLVTESKDAFTDLARVTPGLGILRLRSARRFCGVHLSAFYYLWRESKYIDVLNLYHLSLETKLLSILYRMRNPKGFLYIKLDVNVAAENAALKRSPYRNPLRRLLGGAFHAAFYRAITVVSAESCEAVDIVRRRYPFLANRVLKLTNGLEADSLPHDIDKTLSLKQNLIITVGRIGSFEKNNELLLEAIKHVDLQGWRVAFIGPYTTDFAQAFSRVLHDRPDLKNSVDLIGNVSDRSELMGWYARARIFALTSRSEGFPLVFSEAQCYGNLILSTDVSSVREVTEYGASGMVVPNDDVRAFAQGLRELISARENRHEVASRIATNARVHYDWRHVLGQLSEAIDRHYHV